ncbi:MAG: hypothetical protein ACFHU9_15340 [Fluviicola sp.]
MPFTIASIRTTHDKANSIKENWRDLSMNYSNVEILDSYEPDEFTLRVISFNGRSQSSLQLIPCRLEFKKQPVFSEVSLAANLQKLIIFSCILGALLATLFFLLYRSPIGSLAAFVVPAGIHFGLNYYQILKTGSEYLRTLVENGGSTDRKTVYVG